jgi:hypothetical protein
MAEFVRAETDGAVAAVTGCSPPWTSARECAASWRMDRGKATFSGR